MKYHWHDSVICSIITAQNIWTSERKSDNTELFSFPVKRKLNSLDYGYFIAVIFPALSQDWGVAAPPTSISDATDSAYAHRNTCDLHL